eukprot:m.173900 g.173900  ORF g.173900 m.173900 type:complete len:1192 (-) comp24337_c0_seq1:596-4171(-)
MAAPPGVEAVVTARGMTPGATALMDCFWGLASVAEPSRIASAATLVRLLVAAQKKHVAETEDGSWGADLEYCAKRLIKGLASPRDGARQGYAVALSELIRAIPEFSVPRVIELIDQLIGSAPNGSKAREQKDMQFGYAFGLLGVVQSQQLAKSPECVLLVLGKLLTLSKLKTYLSDVCAQIAVDLIESIPQAVLQEHVAPHLAELLVGETPSKEDFAVALALQRCGVSVTTLGWYDARELGHPKDFAAVATSLSDAGGQTVALPPWWAQYIRLVCNEAADPAVIHKFWSLTVETALFGDNRATVERKALGFTLLRTALPLLTPEQIPGLFTPHLMRSLITNLSTPKNYLHAAAQKAIDAVVALASVGAEGTNDALLLGVVAQLCGSGGSTRFDALTKTKTVETLLAQLTIEGVHTYVRKLFEQFVAAGAVDDDAAEASRQVESQRAYVVDQLLALVRNRRVPRDAVWTLACAQFLFFHAYFEGKPPAAFLGVKGTVKVPLIASTRALCAERWYTVTLELWNVRTATEAPSVADGAAVAEPAAGAAVESPVLDVVNFVMDLELKSGKGKGADSKRSAVAPLPESLAAALGELHAMISRLHTRGLKGGSKGKQTATQAQAFEVLLLHVFVELYYVRGDAEVEMVGDLLRACVEIFDKKQATSAGEEEDGDDHDPFAMLVDILLSFLSRPSASFRAVASHVFGVVSGSLSLGAFSLLLEQLVGEGDEGGEGEHDENGDDSDGEPIKGTSASARSKRRRLGVDENGEAHGDSESSDDDAGGASEGGSDAEEAGEADVAASDDETDDDALDVGGDEVDPELRDSLAETLGVIGALPVEGEEEDSASDLSDWDDDRMMQLDSAIAAQFQLRKSDQKSRKQQKLQSTNFKLRILDLVEVFLRKQPESPLIFELFVPLLECANIATRGGDNSGEHLQSRTFGVVKKLSSSNNKCPEVADDDSDRILAIVDTVFKVACDSTDVKEAECGSAAVLFLIRALAAEHSSAKVAELYGGALKDFASRKASRVRPAMIRQLCQRQPELACSMLPHLAEASSTAINDFRKCQALDLIRTLIQQKKTPALTAALAAHAATVVDHAATTLEKMHQAGASTKVKFVREAIKFVMYFTKRTTDIPMDAAHAERLRVVAAAIADGVLAEKSPPVKVACAQLVAALPTGNAGSASGKKKSRKSAGGKFTRSA